MCDLGLDSARPTYESANIIEHYWSIVDASTLMEALGANMKTSFLVVYMSLSKDDFTYVGYMQYCSSHLQI